MKNISKSKMVSLGLLISLGVFSYFINQRFIDSLDIKLMNLIQVDVPKIFDTPLSVLSLIGSLEVTTLVLFLIIIKAVRLINSVWNLFLYIAGSLVELFGKTFIYHPGPPHNYFRYDLDYFFPSSFVQTNYSYPSGHAYRTTFLVVLSLLLLWKTKYKYRWMAAVIIMVFWGLMLVSRISLGEHWPSDVIAGAIHRLEKAAPHGHENL